MAVYMQVAGVTGDVEEKGHIGWIELNSFQWGVGRGIGSPKSGAKDREGAEASVSELTVSKTQDNATTKLMRLALWGKGKKVEIHFTRTGSNKEQIPYLKYELEDVLLSGYSMSSGGDRPSESVSLNFTKVTYTNLESKDTNEEGDPDRFQYDLATGVGS
jgi:type VI secretion system secreted protein Hcp